MLNTQNSMLGFVEKLIPISDFSRGKTAKIFDDVKNNNTEYIVLKNNQPTALLISLDSYRELFEKASKLERLLDKIEEERLYALSSSRMKKASSLTDLSDVIKEFGLDEDEIMNGADDAEIE